MRLQLLYLLFTVFLLSACNKNLSYFTKDIQKDIGLTTEELKLVQFYLSEDIVLLKSRGTEASRIKDGKIRIKNGGRVEQIVFKRGTPGLAIFSPKNDRIAISFENNDEKYLMFGPNPKASGRYVLLAKDWDRNKGVVTYDGKEYETTSESAYAALLVDIKKARKVSYRSRTARGRTIN